MNVIDSLGYKRDEVTYFIFTSASDLHVKYKLGKTLLHREGMPESEWLELPVWFYRAANVRMMCDAIRYAREQGATSIEFGGEDGSRADVEYISELHREGLRAGGTRPSTPDTVGCYSPFAVREYIPRIKAAAPDAPLVVHFHNDLGLGAWNTVMALGSGAEVFTTSVNGIGERTGNAPMHQVLLQLRYLFGIEIPSFRYERLRDLARLMERLSGIPVSPTEPGIGLNVFSHESGIHTDGIIKNTLTYEPMQVEELGRRRRFVFGKHTGTRAVEARLNEAGVTIGRILELPVDLLPAQHEARADPHEFVPRSPTSTTYRYLQAGVTDGDQRCGLNTINTRIASTSTPIAWPSIWPRRPSWVKAAEEVSPASTSLI